VRKRAVEVLGNVTREQAGNQFSRLQSRVNSAANMDKKPGVRKAAETAARLLLTSPSLETRERRFEEQKRAIAPTLTPLRLVDAKGQPVAGALIASVLWRLGASTGSWSGT
jgi:hypothetical protein